MSGASNAQAPEAQQLMAEIGAALRGQDIPRAIQLARAALDFGVTNPTLLSLRSLGFEQQGRLEDALADLQAARRLAPDRFDILNALGLCLMQAERSREALEAFDAALKLQPDFAPAWCNRGVAQEHMGDLEAARISHLKAVELKPDFAEPLASLAAIAVRRRDLEGAKTFAARALALNPQQGNAAIAKATAEVQGDEPQAAEAGLKALLQWPQVTPFDRAHALGVLGDALDAQDRPAEAFQAWTDGNLVMRDLYRARFEGPGVQTLPMTLKWLSGHFSGSAAGWGGPRRAGPGAGEKAHVFLMGFPRSGTTLLEQVLASHPDVVSLEERETLTESAVDFLSDEGGLTRLAGASVADLEPYRRAYWGRVRDAGVDVTGKVFVDKLPLNTIKLPVIAKLFPEAKILFAVRDPRDVVLSGFRHRFRMNASMYELLTLEGAARLYADVMNLGQLYAEKLQMSARRHRYEDLVTDFDNEVKGIFAFLGLPWREEVRNFAERARAGLSATPSAAQVARGLYRGDGQWRRYARELEPAIPILKPWIERFGYAGD